MLIIIPGNSIGTLRARNCWGKALSPCHVMFNEILRRENHCRASAAVPRSALILAVAVFLLASTWIASFGRHPPPPDLSRRRPNNGVFGNSPASSGRFTAAPNTPPARLRPRRSASCSYPHPAPRRPRRRPLLLCVPSEDAPLPPSRRAPIFVLLFLLFRL